MPNRLLESDFLTINLQSIITKQKGNDSGPGRLETDDIKTEAETDQAKPINWEQELTKRQEANKNMSPESRKTSLEIDEQFFKEYFYANWDKSCAEQLIHIGEPLRKLLKGLGFNVKKNPALGFISNDYVKRNLIQTKLLNINTFKAIVFDALTGKLVAQSEFMKDNDYNIIYCRDLYKKSADEIKAYLEFQRTILKTSVGKYSSQDQIKNKKVFISIPEIIEPDINKRISLINQLDSAKLPSMKQANAVLNNLKFAKAIATTGKKPAETVNLDDTDQAELVGKLKTPSQIFAALQYLSINAGSTKAAKALSSTEKFKGIDAKEIVQATTWLVSNSVIPEGRLDGAQVDKLIDILLQKLQ